jgi:hypothetical protein
MAVRFLSRQGHVHFSVTPRSKEARRDWLDLKTVSSSGLLGGCLL